LAVRSGRPKSLVGGKKLFDGFKHLDGVLGLDLSNGVFDFRYFLFQSLNARESVSNIISSFHSSEKSDCEVLLALDGLDFDFFVLNGFGGSPDVDGNNFSELVSGKEIILSNVGFDIL